MRMETVNRAFIFGDSVMRGVVLDPGKGRYGILPDANVRRVGEEFGIEITNRSSFGCTSVKGEALFSKFLENPGGCDTVLIEYGGNDSNFKWEEIAADPESDHLPATELNVFARTVRSMVDRAKAAGIRPVLMTLPPVDAEKYLNYMKKMGLNTKNILKWLGDAHMIYRFQEMYSAAITALARETGSMLVDVRSYFLRLRTFGELICEDGLHPNEYGHTLIFQAFVDFMTAHNVNGRAAARV